MPMRRPWIGVACLLIASGCFEKNPDYEGDTDGATSGMDESADGSTATSAEGGTMEATSGGDGDTAESGWTDTSWTGGDGGDGDTATGDGDGDTITGGDGDGDGDACDPGLDLCEGECVDLQMNEQHCGMCNNPCPGGGNMCVDGECSG